MVKKNILVPCSMPRDKRELNRAHVKNAYSIIFNDFPNQRDKKTYCHGVWMSYTFDCQKEINHLISICQNNNIDGILNTQDYLGSIVANIVAQKVNIAGLDPKVALLCNHKYLSRVAQQEIVPNATPKFARIDPKNISLEKTALKFPVFIKPIKSYFSLFARKASNAEELKDAVLGACLSRDFLEQFNWFLKHYLKSDEKRFSVLAEEFLEGLQCTLEGFVYENEIIFLGVVDSHMMPDANSFSHFLFPSRLPRRMIDKIKSIAKRFLKGIKYNHGFFNIEFMCDIESNRAFIIEVNPRPASQFADLYEKVLGINSYDLLLSLSVNCYPKLVSKQGTHKMAASMVLRRKKDAKVLKSPSQSQIESFYRHNPDGRFQLMVKEGMRLSDIEQDGNTFRYGLIHLGARDERELFDRFKEAQKILPFMFSN